MQDTAADTLGMIRDLTQGFAAEKLAPFAAAWDRDHYFPVDVLKELGSLGLAGIMVRPEYGGSGLDRLHSAVIFEELSYGCVATAAYLSIHNMVAAAIDGFASESLRQQWLPALCSMEKMASYCLTEPNAGSDAAHLATKAVKDGEHYVLTGSKSFISGASATDVYLVMARTGEAGPKGISAFLIPADAQGLSFGKLEEKMGWNAQPTAMVLLDGVRVHESQRVGAEGEGFRIAMKALDGGRISIASCSLGGARFALDQAQQQILTRHQFGKPLSDFQAIRFKLADMATHLEASRLMVHRAAQAMDEKNPEATKLSAMAKRFATDTCFQIADEALQMFGGYGYLKEYPLERVVRDLRVHRILEGTNEIMRVVISREMLKGNAA